MDIGSTAGFSSRGPNQQVSQRKSDLGCPRVWQEITSILGEDWFMSTVWACAFENFLTRDFEDGSNVVDDYLKRRGWKEGASTRAYMAALRTSVMSLYEVSDIVRDTSFRARDL